MDDGVRECRVGDGGAVEGDDGDVGVLLASECTEGIHTDPPSDCLDPSGHGIQFHPVSSVVMIHIDRTSDL
jgi:hypothetical protein